MRISELLKAEQTRFISLIEVLSILSDHDGGCEMSESAQFLYLKLSTAPNETRPSWETIPCPLSGRGIVQPETKQWDEARSLLECLSYKDGGDIYLSDEEFRKTQIYGFDRGEITAFIASCGANIEANKEVILEQKRMETDIDPADLPEELHAANIAFRAVNNLYGDPSVTFRNRLISYLKTNFPDLSSDAVKRIATVANPDKAPGRKNFNAE